MFLFLLFLRVTVTYLLKSKNLQLRKNNLYLSLTWEVWERSFDRHRFSHDQAEDLVTFYPRYHSWEREKIHFVIRATTTAHFLHLLTSSKLIIGSLSPSLGPTYYTSTSPGSHYPTLCPLPPTFPLHSYKYPTSPIIIPHTETSSPFSSHFHWALSPANCHIPPYPAQIPWWIIIITAMFSFSLTYLPGKIPTLVHFNSSSPLYLHPSNCMSMVKNPQPYIILNGHSDLSGNCLLFSVIMTCLFLLLKPPTLLHPPHIQMRNLTSYCN